MQELTSVLKSYDSNLVPDSNPATIAVTRSVPLLNMRSMFGNPSSRSGITMTLNELSDAAKHSTKFIENIIQANPLFDESSDDFPVLTSFIGLAENYRPPSIYGEGIPINDKLYNANHDKELNPMVKYVISEWDTIKDNSKNWEKSNGQWVNNCIQNGKNFNRYKTGRIHILTNEMLVLGLLANQNAPFQI